MMLRRLLGLSKHRAHDAIDAAHLRRTGTGATVHTAENPGVRLWPDFVLHDEVAGVERAARAAIADFGASHILDPAHHAFFEKQHAWCEVPPTINMLRVTGRYEQETQPVAPWMHGDEFDAEHLPAELRALAERIAADGAYDLGPLRDVTINARHSHFFRLDAHVDPLKDGPNIFIVGLLSDTVLTLSERGPPDSTACDQEAVATRSWVPGRDVDVLLPRLALCHLSGAARDRLNHGIRPGCDAATLRRLRGADGADSDDDATALDGAGALADWFGTPDHVVPRAPERISLVFAFG